MRFLPWPSPSPLTLPITLTITLTLTLALSVCAQQQSQETLMKNCIVQLHDGALLVRLSTKQNAIQALQKEKNYFLAQRIADEQRAYNLEIVNAFRSAFDFCPVYFFYSHDSRAVQDRIFSTVKFLNDSLKEDSSIHFSSENFLIGEFGFVEADTTTYFEDYYYQADEHGLQKRQQRYGSSGVGFGALLIRSDQFVQLTDPFPYYVRTFGALPSGRKEVKVVEKMNEALHEYYGQALISTH